MDDSYPVDITITVPEHSSRLLALMTLLFAVPKFMILVPHLIILWILGIASLAAVIGAQFAVLFTGHYPRTLFDFLVGTQRWNLRVYSYLFGTTDRYPPFRLSP